MHFRSTHVTGNMADKWINGGTGNKIKHQNIEEYLLYVYFQRIPEFVLMINLFAVSKFNLHGNKNCLQLQEDYLL